IGVGDAGEPGRQPIIEADSRLVAQLQDQRGGERLGDAVCKVRRFLVPFPDPADARGGARPVRDPPPPHPPAPPPPPPRPRPPPWARRQMESSLPPSSSPVRPTFIIPTAPSRLAGEAIRLDRRLWLCLRCFRLRGWGRQPVAQLVVSPTGVSAHHGRDR